MPYDPTQHHRRSIRLPGFDYSRNFAYFVTICCQRMQRLFGQVRDGKTIPSELGQVVATCWLEIPGHFPECQLDEFVLMPNHLHGIILIDSDARGDSTPLATVLGSFKSAVTRRINQLAGAEGGIVWQRNYFEHIIRDEVSLEQIRHYIGMNPLRWPHDVDNPDGDGSDSVAEFVGGLGKLPTVPAERASPAHSTEGGACPAPTQAVSVPAEQQSLAQSTKGGACPAPTSARIGHGYDIHRLKEGGRLVLAGVEVAQGISPIAHSDGDVVLHALVDALLGAIGEGDIGELFPNTDPRWKDAESRVFVEEAIRRVRAAGYRVLNADLTIQAERPKLKAFKPAMRERVAAMVDAPVNVKAGTNEGCDAVGRGEAIACTAVVLLAGGE